MKWIKNGAPAGLYAVNASNRPVQIYYDLWRKSNPIVEDRTYIVSLVPAYFVAGIMKYEYYKKKKRLYYSVQWYNEKLDAIPHWGQHDNWEEADAKRYIAEHNNEVAFLRPMVEEKRSLGELTGNKIISNGKEYVELYYVVKGDYFYYFKKEILNYVRFSSLEIDDVKQVDNSKVLYRGRYFLRRYAKDTKEEGQINPKWSDMEYFAFTRKNNELWKRRWVCITPPARCWVALEDVVLSKYSEGKIEDGGVPPVDDDKDNNNQNNNNNNNGGEVVQQQAGSSKLLPLAILGGLTYAILKD